MSREEVIVRFEGISYNYGIKKPILDEVDFSIRKGRKVTLMGQNGAGKSTIFGLITSSNASKPDKKKKEKNKENKKEQNKSEQQGELESGEIILANDLSIATSKQVISREALGLSVREFFESAFDSKVYDIDPKIDDVLVAVNLHVPKHDKLIKDFSGGQQARLLLAHALIQDPDLLLLDEPTNNLDKAGIEHLTKFLVEYQKTVIVISHDAEFLNKFTDGVLYLDVRTKKIEQYDGNYDDVLREIEARVERENRKNALLAKEIQAKKDKSNFFSNKGGQMRMVAKRMREKAAELEEEMVDVRKEDKTIRDFVIPVQDGLSGEVLQINSFLIIKNHKAIERKKKIVLRKNEHLLLAGPNGIGKSTLLEALANGKSKGALTSEGVKIGYYRQDFSNLDFSKTVFAELESSMPRPDEHKMRAVAFGFLINGELIMTKIGDLSEGQKGLVAFARLVLLAPGLLILDEPTNHINFRHLPVIAKALHDYKGAMVVVSHVPEFLAQIRIDQTLDLEK